MEGAYVDPKCPIAGSDFARKQQQGGEFTEKRHVAIVKEVLNEAQQGAALQ
jgi:hypothetical protein